MIFQSSLRESMLANAERIAIEQDDVKITYDALWAMAGSITDRLLKEGVQKETVVGIVAGNRTEVIAAIIGVLNARCVFVMLDGSQPLNRLKSITRNLDLEYLIASRKPLWTEEVLQNRKVTYILTDSTMAGPPDTNEGSAAWPDYDEEDSIYIYFTSGTTGTPKGIVGKNKSLLQFLQWETETFGIKAGTRVSQFISPFFDAFLRDIFAPLLAGGTICIPPASDDFFSAANMVSWIDKTGINLIHCVPSLFRVINDAPLSAGMFRELNYILLSGEKIVPSALKSWYDIFGASVQLVNLYGPTETTMIRTCYKISPSDTGLARIPIGTPIPGTTLLIINDKGKICHTLVPGELYIASPYTTKGYLNAPGLTAEKFVRIQEGTARETIAFRTGDIARTLPDGRIDLLGREDRQVKINGIRVELDEIENILSQCPLIKNAIAIKQVNEKGADLLAAFFIRQPSITGHFKEELELYMASHLPAYMIPSDIIEVDQYPLLSNGKIDYTALLQHRPVNPVVEPANATEEKLLAIWKEIVGDKPISTEEKFQQAGGNSLSIMRLIGKIYKEFKVRISLVDLIRHLTIRQQAAFIDEAGRDDLLVIHPAKAKPAYSLSSAQGRIYFEHMIDKTGTAYNLPMAWEITGNSSREKLEGIFIRLLERHESLRTAFRQEGGRLVQVVEKPAGFTVEEFFCPGDDPDPDPFISGFIRPFDLAVAPLIRCAVIRTGTAKDLLLVDTHHIVCDGVSQGILAADFIRLYRGLDLPPHSVQYKDYAEWENDFKTTQDYLSHREFWLTCFEGEISRLNLPALRQGRTDRIGKGANLTTQLDQARIRPIIDALGKENSTVFSGLLSAFFVFLTQITGQDDIIVGTNSAGRSQHELDEVVGMFTKTLPIRYRIDTDLPFRAIAGNIHRLLIQANSSQVYDLADIISELNAKRAAPVQELVDVMFVSEDFDDRQLYTAKNDFHPYELESLTCKYPLSVQVADLGDTFTFRWEYSSRHFSASDVQVFISLFDALLRQLSLTIDTPLANLLAGSDFLPEAAGNNIEFNF